MKSAPATAGVEGQVRALVNAERAAAGCGPVAADDGLAAVARAHSTAMRDRGFFDHVDPDGLDPIDRADRGGVAARAENIARGQADPSAVMTSWMASPGHRANILNCGLTRLGVGVATGSGGPWWTQLFG
ncbi:CAP domain-containing protein [Blastococcus sp. KM273128]|uniref:CAP domain-containing protein n=1 Tax=Blastococcus sp. KM273128 TaxID=2570314 RepID=UPI001F4563F2|nr:CAP domain-containing protein [Blastococcus sp. KM273128]